MGLRDRAPSVNCGFICGDLESDIELDPLDIVLSVWTGGRQSGNGDFSGMLSKSPWSRESGVMEKSGIGHVFRGHRARDCAAQWS